MDVTPDVPEPVLSGTGLSEAQGTELAEALYAHLGTQIALADTKAQFIIAGDALLATAVTALDRRIVFSLFDASAPAISRIGALLAVLMAASVGVSVYYSLMAAWPSLKLPPRPNLFYFGSIIQLSREEFQRRFFAQESEEAIVALFETIYSLSRISYRKFYRIRRSLQYLVAAFCFWIVFELLLALPH